MSASGQERFVNFYTDFAFKRLFGSEVNKELLISFLNAMFDGKEVITDLTYLNVEHIGEQIYSRKALFDVYCETEKGEKIMVEMQKNEQDFFKDRTLFYATFPIREQAPRLRDWDFELAHVYSVNIMDFVFDKKNPEYFHHEVKLMDTKTYEVFYDKLTFYYIEMPKFKKTEDELETLFDKWLYGMKNLWSLRERPEKLEGKVFQRLFEQAEIAQYTPAEVGEYERSLKEYRDIINVVNTAERKGHDKGMAEGLEKGRVEGVWLVAKNLKGMNVPVEQIAQATGLRPDEILAL